MRVAGVIRDSLVNGEGIRDVLFVQGCPHHCFNCQNPQTWKNDGGKNVSIEELAQLFRSSPNNITISGGEPFNQTLCVAGFMGRVRAYNPKKRFWIYTGYTWDDIECDVRRYMSNYVDVIVDGEYVEDLKDPNCLYRGSTNQRLIDVPRTLATNEIVLWEEKYETQF